MNEGLLRRAEDLIASCAAKNRVFHSGFLSAEDAAELAAALNKRPEGKCFSGGFAGAERTAFFALPPYINGEEFSAQGYLAALLIRPKDGGDYGHRDYLGSVMALGIERDTVGDIVAFPGKAYLVTFPKTAEYLRLELKSVARTSVEVEEVPLLEIPSRQEEVEEFEVSLTSLRADAAVAAVFRLSRGDAAEAIAAGRVTVNGCPLSKPDKPVSDTDLLALRGRGRVRLAGSSGVSRKGKLRVKCLKEAH